MASLAERRGARLVHGDSFEVLGRLDAGAVDGVVTDPPYGIRFMGKAWDGEDIVAETDRRNRKERYLKDGREQVGFGAAVQAGSYDPSQNRAFQTWTEGWSRLAFAALKPGGYLLSFCSTRTSHRMTSGIEDAGFEIRDTIHWTFGSGFPKSLNLDGAGDGWGTALKPAHEHICVARKPIEGTVQGNFDRYGVGALNIREARVPTSANPSAERRLRAPTAPTERIWPDRRSEATFQEPRPDEATGRWPPNFLLTHAFGCRRLGTKVVKGDGHAPAKRSSSKTRIVYGSFGGQEALAERNFTDEVVDAYACAPGCPVALLDAQSGVLRSGDVKDGVLRRGSDKTRTVYGSFAAQDVEEAPIYGDEGGASRFFPVSTWTPEDFDWVPFIYHAKARRSEREAGLEGLAGHDVVGRKAGSAGLSDPRAGAGRTARALRNHHPTVKPISLMEWLVRLVVPEGGLVLDPFTGSGTTGCAALRTNRRFLGVELDNDYVPIARARMDYHARPRLGDEVRPEARLADFLSQDLKALAGSDGQEA